MVNTFPEHLILLLGDNGVGKMAMTKRFFNGSFYEDYDPRNFARYNKYAEIDNQWCGLYSRETCLESLDESSLFREWYIRDGNAFLLVYSVADQTSFMHIRGIHANILEIKNQKSFPLILVANKVDLDLGLRKVSQEQGQELANSLKIPYIETSVKTGLNVEHVFHEAVRLIRSNQATNTEETEINENVNEKKNVRFRCLHGSKTAMKSSQVSNDSKKKRKCIIL